MKKIIFNYLTIAALVVAAAFTSCNKDDDKNENGGGGGGGTDVVKLLTSMTDGDGWVGKFEYDNQSRITKTLSYRNEELRWSYTYIYSGDDVIKITHECVDFPEDNYTFDISKNGNQISNGHNVFDLNSDGYPVKLSFENGYVMTFEYQDGNMTKFHSSSHGGDCVLKYDDKKSPFYHCKSPKWLLFTLDVPFESLNLYGGMGKNNQTEILFGEGGKYEYTYEYDSDGYPSKITVTSGVNLYVHTLTYQ
jgi:YD repeat-containing protein